MSFDTTKCWSLHDELMKLIAKIEEIEYFPEDSQSFDSGEGQSADMNNTKRKFNALLNSIGSSSTDDPSRNKHRRTSYETLPRSSTSHPELSTSSRTEAVSKMSKIDLKFAAANRKTRGANEPAAATKPTFLPGDREDFLQRLASFRNLTDWMPKPPKVNEVAWAKRGWVCQRLERVRCVTCNVEIMVKLNKQEDENGKVIKFAGIESDIEQALVDKYSELMITSHDALCPWRKRGCDDSIFKQPIYPIHSTFQALKARYDSLLPMAALLPAETVFHLPPSYDLDAIIAQLPPPFPTAPSDDGPLNRVALLLALFGFTARPAHVPKLGSADCRVCFRTVGLWLYRPKVAKDTNGVEVQREAAVANFNPLECHKDYCPWVNAESQNPGAEAGGKPIWAVLKEVIGKEDKVRKQEDSSRNGAKDKVSRSGDGAAGMEDGIGEQRDDGEYEKLRDEKDKERWTRLRRVKSLFEVKGKKITKSKP